MTTINIKNQLYEEITILYDFVKRISYFTDNEKKCLENLVDLLLLHIEPPINRQKNNVHLLLESWEKTFMRNWSFSPQNQLSLLKQSAQTIVSQYQQYDCFFLTREDTLEIVIEKMQKENKKILFDMLV